MPFSLRFKPSKSQRNHKFYTKVLRHMCMVDWWWLCIPRCVYLTSEKPPAVTLLKYCRYNQSTFRIAIEITRGLRQRFTWPKLYYLLAAQLTLVMKFKPSIVLCLRIWAIQLKFLTQIKWKYLNYEFLFKRMKLMT